MVPPRVTLVLNTYEDFRDSSGPVIEWLQRVRDLTDPLAASIAAGGRELKPRILTRLRDSDRLSRRKLTTANWELVQSRLRAGELDVVWMEYEPDLAFEIEADLDPLTGREYSLYIELPLLPEGVSPELQSALVGVLMMGAQVLNAATGYLTVDVFPCPYEVVMGSEEANRRRYEEQARGYYWGNVLSAGHVARLGGLEAIRSDAPCAETVDLGVDDRELVFLQATERLDDWPVQSVRALRDYLAPLLPGGVPIPELLEKALHVVEEGPRPVRPPVPGTRYWEFLEGVRSRTGRTPPQLDPAMLQVEADALSPGPPRPISIETTEDLFLDSMEVTLFFDEPPSERDRSDLIRMIEVWAAQGIEGGFGSGVMDSVDRPSFTQANGGDLVCGFLADLGSAGKAALDELIDRLERFAGARDMAVDRIVLGHGGLDL